MHSSTNWEYWDGIYVHWCIDVQQGDQDAEMGCGKILSTWNNPARPGPLHGNAAGTSASAELDLGYTFYTLAVTCPECLNWMNINLNRCIGCQALAEYTFCRKCAMLAIKIDDQIDKLSGRRKPK